MSTQTSRKEIANAWKLLTADDAQVVEQGIHLVRSLDGLAEALLDGTTVNERSGEILRNQRFSGTRNTQHRFDALMLLLLSLAPDDSAAGAVRKAVRKIETTVEFMPTIAGYSSLESLAIQLPLPDGINAVGGLQLFGGLPQLKTFTIKSEDYGRKRRAVPSLAHLHAPLLSTLLASGLELQDIDALSTCAELKVVDLSDNPTLKSIAALAPSASTLQKLNLSGCKEVESLEPLKGAVSLEWLDILNCERIDSLAPLGNSSKLTRVELSGLPLLKSLAGLSGATTNPIDRWAHNRGKEFDIWGCDSLISLEGLPPLGESIETLKLSGLNAMADLRGLQGAGRLKSLELSGEALTGLKDLLRFKELWGLSIARAAALPDIEVAGELPALSSLQIVNCPRVTALPAAWQGLLDNLELHRCDSLKSLGRLPCTLKHLRIVGCRSLKSLAGLEGVEELYLSIESNLADDSSQPAYIEDMSGLGNIGKLKVNYEPARAQYGKEDPRVLVFPESLARALAAVPSLNLVVGDREGSSGSSARDFSALALLRNMRSLDIRACRNASGLDWLLDLPALEFLALCPGSDVAKAAGASTFDNADEVRKLQARLCRKAGRELPAHLKPAAAPATKRAPAPKADKAHASLKKLLKGDEASIQQGLEVLKALNDPAATDALLPELARAIARLLASPSPQAVDSGVVALHEVPTPALFDQLAEAIDPANAYSGDSVAIGKIFKDVREPNRGLARWAMTSLLSLAPAEATQAVRVREQITKVVLQAPKGVQHALSPSLSGFSALETAYLEGFPGSDLQALAGLRCLTKLGLSGWPSLTSLSGLEAAAGLTGFSASSCPKLRDYAPLADKANLKETYEGWTLDIEPDAGLEDVGFVVGLKAVDKIRVKLAPSCSTAPFANAPHITEIHAELLAADIDFSGFRNAKSLSVRLGHRLAADSPSARKDNAKSHLWDYDFPSLKRLSISNGRHDLSALKAPLLAEASFTSVVLPSLLGIGAVALLDVGGCEVRDFTGIEGTRIRKLDLSSSWHKGVFQGLSPLQKVSTLRTLLLDADTSKACASQLAGCAQIRELGIQGYSGDLGFLSGWASLEELDLRESGPLTNLDALAGLATLKAIRIRGAHVKREGWPVALKDILVTR